ncbi:MAG: cytochrome P450, partial [Microcystaceae cyanobacterium]
MTKTLPTPPESTFRQRLEWILDPVAYLDKNQKRYPDLFVSKSVGFTERLIYISHPDAMQQLLTSDRKEFSAPSEPNGILRPLVGDHSITLLEGQKHKKRRQLLTPPFHGERLISYGHTITKITETVMGQLSPQQPFIARKVTQGITLKVILEVVFGIYKGERYDQMSQLLATMLDLFNSPLTSGLLFFPQLQKDWGAWSPWGKFQRQKKAIDQLIYQEIAERREHPNPDRQDVLSLLMASRYEDGSALSDTELRDELMAFLFAGHETTATAIAWGLYWVHRYQEVKEKLRAEIATLGDNPDPMEIVKLPYLTAVCNETLRITPVAMLTFPRQVEEPVNLLGYDLEVGDLVLGCMYMTLQREDLYPNPKQFQPERFLERKYSPYEFIPFGSGSRRCIGDALAMFEMKLAMAHILSDYELSLTDKQPEKLQRRGLVL